MRFKIMSFAAAFLLAACATHQVDRVQLQNQIDTLDRSVINGQRDPAVALNGYKALAQQYPKEPIAVAGYAEALRRNGQAREAANVLRPMVKGQSPQSMTQPIFMAYMRMLLGQGYFADVQGRVQERLSGPVADKSNSAELYNLLGVALAGQGKKAEAEKAFKQALDGWSGRPGLVEQNLAKLKAAKK